MYIYKKVKSKYTLIEYVDTLDDYIIEEHIINYLKSQKLQKLLKTISFKFTGLYTIYYLKDADFVLIVSDKELTEKGKFKEVKVSATV